MAHILLHSLVFAPDGNSSAVLWTELAQELQARGHKITVLTTTPHNVIDTEAAARQPLRKRWGGLLYESHLARMRVLHIAIPSKGKRVNARMLDYLLFLVLSLAAGLLLTRGYDVILAPSPPLTIGVSAWLLGRVRRAPFVYNVQEIYPAIAVRLGVLRNRHLIALLQWLERAVYRRAAVVLVISALFRRHLRAAGVPARKIVLIPNFVDTEFVRPGARHNAFSAAHELDNRFVVLYAGNIGLTQSFETILAAAELLKHLDDLLIVIVGEGSRREWLAAQLVGHPNVLLLPFQPRSLVPQIYAASEVCLVALKRGTAQETFPSKIHTIMSAGRPVIAAVDPDSDLKHLIREAGCGSTVAAEDAGALAAEIERCYFARESLAVSGRAGRDYVVRHYSRRAVCAQYDALLRRVADKPRRTKESV